MEEIDLEQPQSHPLTRGPRNDREKSDKFSNNTPVHGNDREKADKFSYNTPVHENDKEKADKFSDSTTHARVLEIIERKQTNSQTIFCL